MSTNDELSKMLDRAQYNSELRADALATLKEIEVYRIDKELEQFKDHDAREVRKFRFDMIKEALSKVDPKIYLWTLLFILAMANSANFWIHVPKTWVTPAQAVTK